VPGNLAGTFTAKIDYKTDPLPITLEEVSFTIR